MNRRVIRASAHMEWRRNWPIAFKGLATIAVCGVLAAAGPRPVMLFATLISAAAGIVVMSAGGLNAAKERHLGRVGWWRTVPASSTELMLGRLLADAALGVALALGLVPLITLGLREGVVVPSLGVLVLLFGTAALAGAGVAALSTGLALRFRIERVLLILFLLNFLLGDRHEEAIEAALASLGRWLVATAGGDLAFLVPMASLGVTVAGLAGGVLLARWAVATATDQATTLDTTGISRINWTRVRYPAGQPGPVRAVLLLQLRLAAERLPQQAGILLAGVIALPILPEQLARFASFYLPIMMAMIPTAVVGRTAGARMSGTIEGYATLPVRREWVVLGTVLAIAALSLLAIAGVAALRYAAGKPMSVVAAAALWGLTTGGTSLANGMAAWFTPRHLPIVMVLGIGLIGVVAVAMLPIVMAPMTGGGVEAPQVLQLMVGAIGLLLVAPLGGAIYGRGLERFELVRK